MVSDHGMGARDAEVVIAAACLFHDTGMSIHRTDHEQYSLFLAADRLPLLLEGIYEDPELTVVISEALHAVIGHRRRGDPVTIEAGIVRVADALDMASGRSRIPFETRRPNIHSISAAAIDAVKIEPGEERAVRVEIEMNNSSGLFQVDELLATKLRGSGIEEHIEVVARDRRRAREAARARCSGSRWPAPTSTATTSARTSACATRRDARRSAAPRHRLPGGEPRARGRLRRRRPDA